MDKPGSKLVAVEIDQAEVVCILLEEISYTPRPPGMTAREALGVAMVSGRTQADIDELRRVLETASGRIIEYIVDELVRQVPGAVKGITIGGGSLQ